MLTLFIIAALVAIFFVYIPQNHMVCIAVFGKPVHMLCSVMDREVIRSDIQKKLDRLAELKKLPDAPKDEIELIGKDLLDLQELNRQIVCREESLIWWLFVKAFNLHFKSWNPLAGFKKVKVIPNKPNTEYKEGEGIENRIKHAKEKDTIYLRIAFPRIGFAPDRQLRKNIRTHLAWTVNRIVIINPYYIFWENSGVSMNIDTQINTALNSFTPTFLFSEFESEDTGLGKNRLNSFFRDEPTLLNDRSGDPEDESKDKSAVPAAPDQKRRFMIAGCYHFGFSVDAIGILDYELGKDQKELADALTAQEAAKARLETTKLDAEGEAEKVRRPGFAQAEVMERQGDARGKAVAALRDALKDSPHTARILEIEAYGGKVTTLVTGQTTGTGMLLPAAPQPEPPTPQPAPTPTSAPAPTSTT